MTAKPPEALTLDRMATPVGEMRIVTDADGLAIPRTPLEVLRIVLNQPNASLDAMTAQGFSPDQALRQLEGLVQSQAVMLSTNQMYMATAVVFAVAATTIWLAPRPKRAAAPGGGH